MKIRKFVLGYYAILFLFFGIAGLVLPDLVTNLIHYNVQSPGAKMEFMATYGGLFIGFGVFMFYCLKSNIEIGLVSVLLTMGAMLLARLVGYFSFGGADVIQYVYLAGELFTVLLVAFLLIKPNSQSEPSLVDSRV